MDGGEQTLEKHKADEYEQIRITRARQPRRVRVPRVISRHIFFLIIVSEMSSTLNYWLLIEWHFASELTSPRGRGRPQTLGSLKGN